MYNRQCRKTVLLGCIYKAAKCNVFSQTMTVQLEYINHLLQIFPTMLALCLMLSVTYYAQNYAAIIGWSLQVTTKSRTYIVTLDMYLSHSLNLGPIYTGRKGNSNIYLRLN